MFPDAPPDWDQPQLPPRTVTDDEFERYIMPVTLKHEGGFVDNPADPGGATNFGISLRWLRSKGLDVGDIDGDGDVDADDIRALTPEQAIRLYRQRWWSVGGYADFCNVSVAGKVFDLAVNMGQRPAARIVQRACRAHGIDLVDDGLIGPKSLAAIQQAARSLHMLPAIRAEAAGHYRLLIAKNPALATFERGWLRRAYS